MVFPIFGKYPCAATIPLAIDSQETSGVGHNSTTSPLTWSFNNVSGTFLLVGVTVNAVTEGAAPTVTGVTYNGVAMTAVPGASVSSFVSFAGSFIALYYLISPATGFNTVSVSFAGTDEQYLDAICGAISFRGASALAPVGNGVNASNTTGSSTVATVAVPGTTSGDYVVSLVATGTSVGSATAPTTLSWLLNISTSDGADNAAMGQQTTSGGTVNPTYSVTADYWFIVAAEVFA